MTTRSRTPARRFLVRPGAWASSLALALLFVGAAPAGAQHGEAPAAAAQEAPAEGHTAAPAAAGEHGEAAHEESLGSFLSRLANFAILAGALWYLLRSPIRKYLADRAGQIRKGLADAAELKASAEAQRADVEARMKSLPGEIEILRARGAQEVAAEEARIREAAEAERQRLVDQARREVDLQLQAARRDLTQYAADLAEGVATERVKAQITAEDQRRLTDRYLSQVKTAHD